MSFWKNPIAEIKSFFTKPSVEQEALKAFQMGIEALENAITLATPLASLYAPVGAAIPQAQALLAQLDKGVQALEAAIPKS